MASNQDSKLTRKDCLRSIVGGDEGGLHTMHLFSYMRVEPTNVRSTLMQEGRYMRQKHHVFSPIEGTSFCTDQFLYSLRPTLFVLFEKSNFLKEHHLLSCLLLKMYKFPKLPLNKLIKKLNY